MYDAYAHKILVSNVLYTALTAVEKWIGKGLAIVGESSIFRKSGETGEIVN
jgi:hypothetical protein